MLLIILIEHLSFSCVTDFCTTNKIKFAFTMKLKYKKAPNTKNTYLLNIAVIFIVDLILNANINANQNMLVVCKSL